MNRSQPMLRSRSVDLALLGSAGLLLAVLAAGAPSPVQAATTLPMVTAVMVSPGSVTGGERATGTVTLSAVAPRAGVSVSLSSSNTTAAMVPGSVIVPAGAKSAQFSVQTRPVNANPNVFPPGMAVTIRAGYRLSARETQLKVLPPVVEAVHAWGPEYGGRLVVAGVKLTGPAPAEGVSVNLASSNTAAATVSASVRVPAGAQSVWFNIQTYGVTQTTTVTVSAWRSWWDKKEAALTLLPPELWLLTASPTTVVGGQNSQGKVLLHGRVAAGRTVQVSLSSSNTGVATVPATVSVQGGAYTATFTIQTKAVPTSTHVYLRATYAGKTVTRQLIVQPPTLASLSVSPGAVVGGNNANGRVKLSGPAPTGGVVVSLSANLGIVQVPGWSVTVPAGATQKSFSIATSGVSDPTMVVLSASSGGVTKEAELRVNPAVLNRLLLNGQYSATYYAPPEAGVRVTGYVELNGSAPAGGARVALSSYGPVNEGFKYASVVAIPQYVEIPAGQKGATFPVVVYPNRPYFTTPSELYIQGSYREGTRKARVEVH